MKIIQSFAEFDEGSYYLRGDKKNGKKNHLNFYSMLLSVLTLQKYYGEVTMYCNQKAYDNLIKYLPYHEIKIVENKNPFTLWSYYKVDIIKKQTAKFIHVDPDVFIFDDLFSEFIKTRKYDIIVQDTIPPYINPISSDDIALIKEYLKKNELSSYEFCDGKAFSNGVAGMTVKVKKEFIKLAEQLRDGFIRNELGVNPDLIAMIAEELALYLVAMDNGYEYLEILPYDDVQKNGSRVSTNEKKYTHMWGDSKFNPQYIEVMKLKTIKEFPEHSDLITRFESEVMDKIMV